MAPGDLEYLPADLREPHVMEWPGLLKLYVVALVVAGALGLIGGALFIAWQLLQRYVLP